MNLNSRLRAVFRTLRSRRKPLTRCVHSHEDFALDYSNADLPLELHKRSVGETYYDLLVTSSWVHRQVDALRIEDAGLTRRFVSLDLTVPDDLPDWREAHTTSATPQAVGRKQMALPLAFLEKKVIQRLDVSYEGKSLPVLTSWQNVEVAKRILEFLVGSLDSVSEKQRTELNELAGRAAGSSSATEDEANLLKDIEKKLQGIADNHDLSDREAAALLGLNNYIQTFVGHFVLLALVPSDISGRRVVLKYSHDQIDERPRTPYWGPLRFTCVVPISWRTASHHVEVQLPQSLQITQIKLDAANKSASEAVRSAPLAVSMDSQGMPLTSSTAHVILPLESRDSIQIVPTRQLDIYAVPAPQGVRGFTYASAAAVSGVVLISLFGRWGWVVSPEFAVPSTAASLLLIGPALLLSWLARSKEHQIVAVLLRPLRAILLVLAAVLVAMAALAAVPVFPLAWSIAWWMIYGATFVAASYTFALSRGYRKRSNVAL